MLNIEITEERAKVLLELHGLAGHEGWAQLDDEMLKQIEEAFPHLKRENYYRDTADYWDHGHFYL